MTHNWKTGDLAIRRSAITGKEGRSFVVDRSLCGNDLHPDSLHWHHESGGWDELDNGLNGRRLRASTYRPLLAIDPDRDEDVARLAALYDEVPVSGLSAFDVSCMRDALRKFANPDPDEDAEHVDRIAVAIFGDAFSSHEGLREAQRHVARRTIAAVEGVKR